MNALLLSAYDAGSHRRWRSGLVDTFPDIDWTVLTLPPRNFAWRTRGNALWWAFEEREVLARKWDLVVATSTVDVAALIGLVPSLADARVVVYFHENQFAYPTRGGESDPNYLVRDIYCAAAADAIAFNSAFNRDSFFEGATAFGRLMPDFWPSGLVDELEQRSTVVPVGLERGWFEPRTASPRGPLQIVWNHRWEYDKGPERLFRAAQMLSELGVDYELHVVGQVFREIPDAFAQGRERLGDRAATWGWIEDPEAYRALLRCCDVVISTALHEFQGLAVLEATAAGCLPVVPDRLAYRELFPEWCTYAGDVDDPERDAKSLTTHLAQVAGRLDEIRGAPAPDVTHLSWEALKPSYAALLRG